MSDDLFAGTPAVLKVEEFIGEGKKYATPEKALESIPHKELLISSLEKQVKDLHDELSKRATLESVLETLKKPQETPATSRQEPSVDASLLKEIENRLGTQLTEKLKQEIQAAVPTALQASTEQQSRASNRQAVSAALQAAYGDQAVQALANKAAELGMTPAELGALAERSPKAVLAYFSIQGKSDTGSVNTSSTGGTPGVREGTEAWWKQFRRANPTEYMNPKTQAKILADRKRLGEDFYK